VKLNSASGDLERLRDEKDQEIMILQAGMDSTIEQLSEAQQVPSLLKISTQTAFWNYFSLEPGFGGWNNQRSDWHIDSGQPQEAQPDYRCVWFFQVTFTGLTPDSFFVSRFHPASVCSQGRWCDLWAGVPHTSWQPELNAWIHIIDDWEVLE